MFLCSLRYCLKCYFSKGVYSFTLSTVHINTVINYVKNCESYRRSPIASHGKFCPLRRRSSTAGSGWNGNPKRWCSWARGLTGCSRPFAGWYGEFHVWWKKLRTPQKDLQKDRKQSVNRTRTHAAGLWKCKSTFNVDKLVQSNHKKKDLCVFWGLVLQ